VDERPRLARRPWQRLQPTRNGLCKCNLTWDRLYDCSMAVSCDSSHGTACPAASTSCKGNVEHLFGSKGRSRPSTCRHEHLPIVEVLYFAVGAQRGVAEIKADLWATAAPACAQQSLSNNEQTVGPLQYLRAVLQQHPPQRRRRTEGVIGAVGGARLGGKVGRRRPVAGDRLAQRGQRLPALLACGLARKGVDECCPWLAWVHFCGD